MSDTPGTVAAITRPAKSGGYVPHVWTGNRLGIAIDGRPRFTWLEAERMRYDPQIQFGLRILRAPLYGVTWETQADSPAVQQWIDREWGRIYRRLIPRLVRFYEYGVAAGEVTYKQLRSRATGRTRIHFDDFLEFHPRDARPLVYERGRRSGDLAGLHVTSIRGGSIYLDRRHGFWFAGESEYGEWFGRPRLSGAYEPWVEKRGRHGAIDSRRLFFKKCAFRGPRMRYPIGKTDLGTPDTGTWLVSNQDIARELVEKFENGGVLALPNVKGPNGEDLWSWEDPESFADVAKILDYPHELDKEILIGFGVPPELVEASTVGSGYSGRAIPAQVFFTSMDEVVNLIFEAIDTQIMRFLVRLNFGKRVNYEVVPRSLAQLMAQGGPAGPGQAPPPGMAGAPAGLGGGHNSLIPYQGPRGGHGLRDPQTGNVRYGADQEPEKSYLRLSQRAEEIDTGHWPQVEADPRTLWQTAESDVYAEQPEIVRYRPADESVRLSWEEAEHPRGQPDNAGEFAAKTDDAAAQDAEIRDLERRLREHHTRRADELDRQADDAEAHLEGEMRAGLHESHPLTRATRSLIDTVRRMARERRELAAGGSPDASWLDSVTVPQALRMSLGSAGREAAEEAAVAALHAGRSEHRPL